MIFASARRASFGTTGEPAPGQAVPPRAYRRQPRRRPAPSPLSVDEQTFVFTAAGHTLHLDTDDFNTSEARAVIIPPPLATTTSLHPAR